MQRKTPAMRLCFTLLAGLFALSPAMTQMASGGEEPERLVLPFRSARAASDKSGEIACSNRIPRAPDELIFKSRYEDEDRTRSTVNEEASDYYESLIRPLRKVELAVVNYANDHLRGKKGAAGCAARILVAWADQKALLNLPVNDQGQMVRAWMLASFGSAWGQVRDSAEIEGKKRNQIDHWMIHLTDIVAQDFRPGQDARGKNNNHAYWANWAVAVSSAALQNRAGFEAAQERYRMFLQDILSDGSLVYERTRGQRILYYHVYAAGPLYLQTEIFRRNKMVKKADLQAMDRLMNLVAVGVMNPDEFRRRANVPEYQDRSFMKTTTPDILRLALCRAPDHDLYRQAYAVYKRINPESGPYVRLGGDLSLLRSCGTKAAKLAFE